MLHHVSLKNMLKNLSSNYIDSEIFNIKVPDNVYIKGVGIDRQKN